MAGVRSVEPDWDSSRIYPLNRAATARPAARNSAKSWGCSLSLPLHPTPDPDGCSDHTRNSPRPYCPSQGSMSHGDQFPHSLSGTALRAPAEPFVPMSVVQSPKLIPPMVGWVDSGSSHSRYHALVAPPEWAARYPLTPRHSSGGAATARSSRGPNTVQQYERMHMARSATKGPRTHSFGKWKPRDGQCVSPEPPAIPVQQIQYAERPAAEGVRYSHSSRLC
jgi:hypothetical protein